MCVLSVMQYENVFFFIKCEVISDSSFKHVWMIVRIIITIPICFGRDNRPIIFLSHANTHNNDNKIDVSYEWWTMTTNKAPESLMLIKVHTNGQHLKMLNKYLHHFEKICAAFKKTAAVWDTQSDNASKETLQVAQTAKLTVLWFSHYYFLESI